MREVDGVGAGVNALDEGDTDGEVGIDTEGDADGMLDVEDEG